VAGAAAGVYATSKARRAAEALTVDGFHDRLTGWFAGARVLRDEVRAGATEKETELRHRLAVVPDGGALGQLEGRPAPARHLQLAEPPHEAENNQDDTSTGRDDH
jgi:hypothetical protein